MTRIVSIVEGHGELDAVPILLRRIAAAALPAGAVDARDRAIRVVLAKTEYEAWFLAAADSIAGKHGIDAKAAAPANPEAVRGAKEWLTGCMPAGQSYRPTRHQAALLWRDVTALLEHA